MKGGRGRASSSPCTPGPVDIDTERSGKLIDNDNGRVFDSLVPLQRSSYYSSTWIELNSNVVLRGFPCPVCAKVRVCGKGKGKCHHDQT